MGVEPAELDSAGEKNHFWIAGRKGEKCALGNWIGWAVEKALLRNAAGDGSERIGNDGHWGFLVDREYQRRRWERSATMPGREVGIRLMGATPKVFFSFFFSSSSSTPNRYLLTAHNPSKGQYVIGKTDFWFLGGVIVADLQRSLGLGVPARPPI